jgi:hypothetical protein
MQLKVVAMNKKGKEGYIPNAHALKFLDLDCQALVTLLGAADLA